jgi:hypothetical protein
MSPRPPADEEGRAPAPQSPPPGLAAELWDFVRHHPLWWLLPMVIVLLLFAALIWLSGTGAAPFIYQAH